MSYNKNIVENFGTSTFDTAYNYDSFGYVGPRTQYDLDLQKKWCPTCGGPSCMAGCNNTNANIQSVSTSAPYAYPMMRTSYDMNMRKTFSPEMGSCMAGGNKNVALVATVSTSEPYAYPMMRTSYDMNMRKTFSPEMGSCMAGNASKNDLTKENFSYALSFNDPTNIYSYSGDINCAATCGTNCSPYPMPVTNCGGSFEIVRGLGCADGGCTKPAPTCSNYIVNPYQNTGRGCGC
jgi:hypothetical protein